MRTGAVGWGIVAGLVGSTGLVLFYAALSRGTMGVVAPIAGTGVVVPVAAGLLQGDEPGAVALVGIVSPPSSAWSWWRDRSGDR